MLCSILVQHVGFAFPKERPSLHCYFRFLLVSPTLLSSIPFVFRLVVLAQHLSAVELPSRVEGRIHSHGCLAP